MPQPDPAVCQCNRPKGVNARYCRICAQRWRRAGKPESGPPPEMPYTESLRRANEALRVRLETHGTRKKPEVDAGYDALWRQVQEPQRRIERAAPVAACLARCVATSDAEGVSRLLARYHDRHPALLIVLAATANPALARIVARVAPERKVRRAGLVAGHLIAAVAAADRAAVARVLSRWICTWDEFAAVAVVLAEASTPVVSVRSAA